MNQEPPIVEHDPNERDPQENRWALYLYGATMLGISMALAAGRRETLDFGYLDYTAIGLFLLLVAWLLLPDNPRRHESPGNGFAFRLGKKLKRVLNHGRRRPAARDDVDKFLN